MPRRSSPYVSWGTNPAQSTTIDGVVPGPRRRRGGATGRCATWTCAPGTPIREIRPDTIFIGSCTNSRIEDLRVAADVVRGRKVKAGLRALVVPGSVAVKLQAEREGLDAGLLRRGVRVARRGVLDVSGHEPGHPRPRRSQRVDQQPQLRGPPGQGRPHAPGQPAGGRRHRDRRPLHDARRTCTMEPVTRVEGTALPLDRADVDTDQIIPARVPEARRADRVRPVPVRRVAQGPRVHPQRRALRRRHGPARRRELRVRVEPRARAVGDRGPRVPRGDRAELRRHLPEQLPEDRAAPRRAAATSRSAR